LPDRVYVTGGTGLIGSALVARLLEQGDEVVALARSDEAAVGLEASGATAVRGDLLDEDALAAGMAGCRLAFNVAGLNTLCPTDPAAMLRVNADGPPAVARASARAGVERLVHTSSAAALGEAEGTVGREDSPHRGSYLSMYERSKHEGELALQTAAGELGLDAVCVNPSSVQGPGRASGTGRILLALLDGRLNVFVDTRISLVDIDDCVEGHLLAAEHGVPGERYVLNGVTFSSPEALALLSSVAGVECTPRMAPPWLARVAGAGVEAACRALGRKPPLCREMVDTILHGHRYDGSRATRELGLVYTPPEETLRRIVRWALDEGLVSRPAAPVP
jgi:dihydroflavonol-4-reductase